MLTRTPASADELITRAKRAYFLSCERQRIPPEIPANTSGMETYNGKEYVVLKGAGIIAIYRVRNDGALKRLRRWPAEIVDNA